MSEPGNIPENFAASLLAAMPDAVIYADIEGRIRFWNAGASLDIITPEGLRARHWHGYAQTMRTGKTQYWDGQLLAVPALRRQLAAFGAAAANQADALPAGTRKLAGAWPPIVPS